MSIIFIYLLAGAFAGVLSGMLGVGGGIILVPILIIIFSSSSMPAGLVAHMAIGTSLSTIIFTSMSAIYAQHRRRAIDWVLTRKLAPAIILGSLISGYLAGLIPGLVLKVMFGLFLSVAALQLFFEWRPAPYRTLPGQVTLVSIGTGIGALSALLGIGGGTILVPFFHWCNVDLRKAIATSTTLGFGLAVFGTIGFIMSGLERSGLPSGSYGYVSVPALIGISSTAMLFAPYGVYLSHRVPLHRLKRIFSLLLLCLAVNIVVGLI
jgi:uncharacterized membrane protein YfcA